MGAKIHSSASAPTAAPVLCTAPAAFVARWPGCPGDTRSVLVPKGTKSVTALFAVAFLVQESPTAAAARSDGDVRLPLPVTVHATG